LHTPRPCSLYVVHHGRTALNVDDRYLGALDPPLDELGLEQAANLARLLQGRASAILFRTAIATSTRPVINKKINNNNCLSCASQSVVYSATPS